MWRGTEGGGWPDDYFQYRLSRREAVAVGGVLVGGTVATATVA